MVTRLGWLGRDTRGVLTMLGMVAQMERRFIEERQREDIERAKAEGTYRGGQRQLDRDHIRALHEAGSGLAAIARTAGCSRMQAYRVLQEGITTFERISGLTIDCMK